MTKQNGGPNGTPEGSEIRRDVVDGGDESLVHDMGDSYEDTACECRGQKKAHHGRSLAETPCSIRHLLWIVQYILCNTLFTQTRANHAPVPQAAFTYPYSSVA